jgi:hypothetical protein
VSDFLRYLWRHPRRTGFIAFNALVVVTVLCWALFTKDFEGGLAGVPNLMLGYTGMWLLLVAWAGGWIAWAIMVARRHYRAARPPAAQPSPAPGPAAD